MNTDELLKRLGALVRDEEAQFEERWEELARGVFTEHPLQASSSTARLALGLTLVERLCRPLSPADKARLTARLEALLRDDEPKSKRGSS